MFAMKYLYSRAESYGNILILLGRSLLKVSAAVLPTKTNYSWWPWSGPFNIHFELSSSESDGNNFNFVTLKKALNRLLLKFPATELSAKMTPISGGGP